MTTEKNTNGPLRPMLSLAGAQDQKRCRICGESVKLPGAQPSGWPYRFGSRMTVGMHSSKIILNFGKEFAHSNCLEYVKARRPDYCLDVMRERGNGALPKSCQECGILNCRYASAENDDAYHAMQAPRPPALVPHKELSDADVISMIGAFRAAAPRNSRWRHVATGTVYRVVDVSLHEADLSGTVHYVRADGPLVDAPWDRPLSEFTDGRFQRVQ